MRRGDRPKEWITKSAPEDDSDLVVTKPATAPQDPPTLPPAPERYKIQFTASQDTGEQRSGQEEGGAHHLRIRSLRTTLPPPGVEMTAR